MKKPDKKACDMSVQELASYIDYSVLKPEFTEEEIIALTPLWKGERFEDGRPKVPQKYLDEMRNMTLEELWKPIFL